MCPRRCASAGGGIAAVSRIPNSMEVWWIGQNGSVQDANWYEGGEWERFALAPAGSVFNVDTSGGGIAAVSRIPSSMEIWWVGADGSIQDNCWYDDHLFPDSRKWDHAVTFSGGTALGGRCSLAVNNKGDWTFSGHLHDSGGDLHMRLFLLVTYLLH